MAEQTVTRIKASESKKPSPSKKPTKAPKESDPNPVVDAFKAFGGYFKGAWKELQQVRWPTRSATWGLTGAVLLFSAFFVLIILGLDALFNWLFDLLLR